jgi:hypothetical protein
MADAGEGQPVGSNGSAAGRGAQIITTAVEQITTLGDELTTDALGEIIEAALADGAERGEADVIWERTKGPIGVLGVSKGSFRQMWTDRAKMQLAAEQQARREAALEAKERRHETDEELQQERDRLYAYVKPLLDHPAFLDAVADAVDALGAAGVQSESKALYLAGISALSLHPISIDVHGPSSIGKSYLAGRVLTLFPPSAIYAFTSASARVFYFDEEDCLQHKIVYAGEAVSFYASKHDDDTTTQIAALIRQVQSEGRIIHKITVKDELTGALTAATIEREGPIALLVTSTQDLHAENATRNLALHLSETAEQTRAIIDKRMVMRMHPDAAAAVDLDRWHALHAYIACGPCNCVVPYARALGRLLSEHQLRVRRDADAIITAIEAHALLNQEHREQDRHGRWIATLEDYAAIQPVFDAILAHGREDALSEASRRLYGHIVQRLKEQNAARPTVKTPRQIIRAGKSALPAGTLVTTQRQLAAELGSGKASIARNLQELYDLQLINNTEVKPRQPLCLRVLAHLPDKIRARALPDLATLTDAWDGTNT